MTLHDAPRLFGTALFVTTFLLGKYFHPEKVIGTIPYPKLHNSDEYAALVVRVSLKNDARLGPPRRF